MDESALALAGRLLAGVTSLEFAAFGRLDPVSATLFEGGWGDLIPIEGTPFRSDWETPSILAVDQEDLFLIHRSGESVSARRLPVFDVCAKLDAADASAVVRLEASDIVRRYFDPDLGGVFTLSENAATPGGAGLGQLLTDSINRAGDPGHSRHALVRFLARSIRAHQANEPPYLSEILPSSYRSFVRMTSVGGAMRDLAEKDSGWFPSFIAAFDAAVPVDDEIFLLKGERWIVTNRRLYLVDANVAESIPLDSIRRYHFHGLLRRSLEIQLTSGAVAHRSGPEELYLSAQEFERLMRTLSSHGAIGHLSRGHA